MNVVNPYIIAPTTVGVFSDDFGDSSFDTGKWSRRNTDANVTVSESSTPGYLELGSSTSGAVDDAIESISTFDITGRTWSCEFDIGVALNGYFWIFGIEDNSAGSNPNRIAWYCYAGGGGTTMNTQYRTGGTSTNGTDYLWSSGVMKFVRFIHNSGTDTVTLQRSDFGVTWTTHTTISSASSLFTFSTARAFVWITGGGGFTAPRSALFRNFLVA